MSDDIKDNPLENLTTLDAARIKRLKIKGNYYSLVDEFEQLRLKFNYEPSKMEKNEAIRFITLCKFFIESGHSESFKLHCKYIYEKYIGKFGL